MTGLEDSGMDTADALSPPVPPPLPPADELECLVTSGEASLQAAWAITCRDTEHALSVLARRDTRTGQLLPQRLSEVLSRLAALEAGCRLPHDTLQVAAEFGADALARLLKQHRHHIRRRHELMPLHALREVDSRCNAWLARQPGRNVREKLAAKPQVMGVRRQQTADTSENRLLGDFARLLGRRISDRLSQLPPSQSQSDQARRITLESVRSLCEERFRRSDLSDLSTLAHFRPNNVLLGDPDYSRLYRAWRWLRHEGASRARYWPHAPLRATVLLYWLLAGRLAARFSTVLPESLARVVLDQAEGTGFGIEVWSGLGDEPHWQPAPRLQFQAIGAGANRLPLRILLSLAGGEIRIRLVGLPGADHSIAIALHRDTGAPLAGRGIPMRLECAALEACDGMSVYADLLGLAPIAEQVAQHLLKLCGSSLAARKPRPLVATEEDVAASLVGMALGHGTIRLKGGQRLTATVPGWAAAFQLPSEGDLAEWIDGAEGCAIVAGEAHRQLWSIGDILVPDDLADYGRMALAARQIMSGLGQKYGLQGSTRLAYAVPDAIDEISQGVIRAALAHAFERSYPVWRSVAAAVGWSLQEAGSEPRVRPEDQLIVVDTEFPEVSMTVLVARHDAALERGFPGSNGISWERKPALAPDEELDLLGWPRIVEAYARHVLGKALHRPPESDADGRVLDDLLRTGVIRQLIRDKRQQIIALPGRVGTGTDLLRLEPDADWLSRETEKWMARIADCIDKQLRHVGKGRRRHILLIGGPSELPTMPGPERMSGTLKMFNAEKRYGFIRSKEDGSDIFLPPGACAPGLESQLLPGMALEFEVTKGAKGPQARLVRADSGLQGWARLQAHPVSADTLAAGTLECLCRMTEGCVPWREWLPSLSLEVIRDGHYGEIRLLDGTQAITPFLGEDNSFDIPGSLILAPGQPWYSFPLLIGTEGQRPLAWEARLDSPAFPLTSALRVRLQLSYQYGLERSYRLVVLPEETADLSRTEARWMRGSVQPQEAETGTPHVKASAEASWPASIAKELLAAVQRVHSGVTDEQLGKSLLPTVRRAWADGRTLAKAPAEVREVVAWLKLELQRRLPAQLSLASVPVPLRILALMHADAPAEVVEQICLLEASAGDDKDMSDAVVKLLRDLVGDGTGNRRAVLSLLMTRLARSTALATFNPALARQVLQSLSTAAWRNQAFAASLTDAEVVIIISRVQRSMMAMLGRVPVKKLGTDDKDALAKRYGYPFRDMCKLLLALIWLRPYPPVSLLSKGSPTAEMLAKAIRQLDARFAYHEINLDWQQGSTVEVPAELHRMSRVAFALDAALASSQATNLAQYSEVEHADA